MNSVSFTRRAIVGVVGTAAGAVALGGRSHAQLSLPKSPMTVNVVDAAGDLALTQKIFENYAKTKPTLVSKFNFTKAPLPELPGKIKAQQDAGRVDIDLALVGYSGVATGGALDIWMQLLPTNAAALPNLDEIYLDGARAIQALSYGRGILVSYTPFGPLLEYRPEAVETVPTTADELLAWTRANKGRFMYARPSNSGPGLAFLAGLPYILGDADPRDPAKGWNMTWGYLKALGENIEYYPSGTSAMSKEFGEGSRDMMPNTTGFDINPRALGIVPESAKIATLKGFHWISDAHFACVPKGVRADKVALLLDLIAFLLTKEQQAYIFDAGYYYPGPAVKGVTQDMAPRESQAVLKEFGRPEYDRLIADNPVEPPLDPIKLASAFRRWDEEIGNAKH
jgi:putative spermidine/putrescine transport system substrate-binding protein